MPAVVLHAHWCSECKEVSFRFLTGQLCHVLGATPLQQRSKACTALLAISCIIKGFEEDCREEHAQPASQAAIIRVLCSSG